MGKTIRVSDEDYEKAVSITEQTNESMAELFSRALKLLEGDEEEGNHGPTDIRNEQEDHKKMLALLFRLIRAICPLTEEDANDPDFGIGLVEVYEDMNEHPEKYTRNY